MQRNLTALFYTIEILCGKDTQINLYAHREYIFMKVLVAYDGSETSNCALEFSLRMKNVIDKYYIVYVIPQLVGTTPTYDTYVPESLFDEQQKRATEILEGAKKMMKNENADVEYRIEDSGSKTVGKKISELVNDYGVDMVITGSRNLKGLSKIILGSVSSEILKLSDVPVLICSADACK